MAREQCGAAFRCFQTSHRVGPVPWAKQAGLPGPKGLFLAGLRESERPCPSPRGVLSLADRIWPSALGPLTRAAVGLAQGQCSKWTRVSCGLDRCASGRHSLSAQSSSAGALSTHVLVIRVSG